MIAPRFAILAAAVLLGVSPLLATGCKAEESENAHDLGRWQGEEVAFDVVQRNTKLTGQAWVVDPLTGELLQNGEIVGTREGSVVHLKTTTGAVVEGTLSDTEFKGTIVFPGFLDYPESTHDVLLSRKVVE